MKDPGGHTPYCRCLHCNRIISTDKSDKQPHIKYCGPRCYDRHKKGLPVTTPRRRANHY